jgi:hypothetical protein
MRVFPLAGGIVPRMTVNNTLKGRCMDHDWEQAIWGLLNELTAVQADLLEVLGEKQRLLAVADLPALAGLQDRERLLAERLEACHIHRGELLSQAANEGLSAESIRELSETLPRQPGRAVVAQFRRADVQSRLLRHQSLANWVLAQRSLMHLSQLLEIIATGGRPCPTYEKGAAAHLAGSLVDQAV